MVLDQNVPCDALAQLNISKLNISLTSFIFLGILPFQKGCLKNHSTAYLNTFQHAICTEINSAKLDFVANLNFNLSEMKKCASCKYAGTGYNF